MNYEQLSTGTHPEDWYPTADRIALAHAAEQVIARVRGGANVEVGSFTGQSATMLARMLGSLICVDPWGAMDYADRPDIAAGEALDVFRENTAHLPIARMRCGWEQFFELFDGPLRFLHIDAVHEYDHVRRNIEAALPLLTPGGVLCGHDYWDMFPGVEQAVQDALSPLGPVVVEARVWSWRKP